MAQGLDKSWIDTLWYNQEGISLLIWQAFMKSGDVLEVFKCNTSFFGDGSSEELGYKVGLQILVREHDRNRWEWRFVKISTIW